MIKPTKAVAVKILELLDHGLVKGVGTPVPGKMCIEAAVCFALGLTHGDDPPCVGKAVRAFKITLNDSEWSSNKARADGMRRIAIAQLGSNEIDQTIFVKELALATVRQIVPIALRAAAKVHPDVKHREALEVASVNCEKCDSESAKSAAESAWWAAKSAAEAAWLAAESAKSAESAAKSAAESAKSAWWAAKWAAESACWTAKSAAESAWWAAESAKSAKSAAEAAWSAKSAAESAWSKDQVLSIMAEAGVQALITAKSPGCKWLDLVKTK